QGTRTLSLEKRFVNSIVDFWKKEVIHELKDINDIKDLHDAIIEITSNLQNNLTTRTQSHIEKILCFGLFKSRMKDPCMRMIQ
ncbi:MAG: hypothetical protein OEZ01_03855, partial [Candidatus Heimdallarchaeota archaeon]|nr:hypothetical protein [Candidatus Heimdallarchaeota archaeon]